MERDTLPIAHGWQKKEKERGLMPTSNRKTGLKHKSRESCYRARTHTPTREKNGWMEVVLSRATSTDVPTDRGRSAHVWACHSRGRWNVPNRTKKIWPLTGEPGAAGERLPFSADRFGRARQIPGPTNPYTSKCMQGKHLAGTCRTAHTERALLPVRVTERWYSSLSGK